MRFAVALATHQGERHLDALLQSLAQQDRPPEVLVVHDDASTDGTASVLARFAATAPFRVVLELGQRRRGPAAAFESALALVAAEHDLDAVALCDQDDVWATDKLRRLGEALEAEPTAHLAWSDAELVDEQGRPTGVRRWAVAGFDRRRRAALVRDPLAVLADRYLVAGCTMAFRAADLPLVLPFPAELDGGEVQFLHDAWITTVLSSLGPVALVDRPLVAQRVHPGQAVGLRAPRWRRLLPSRLRWTVDGLRTRRDAVHRRARAELLGAADRALRAADVAGARRSAGDLAAAAALVARRAAVGGTRRSRLRPIASAVRRGGYRRFAAGWASAAYDLVRRPVPGAPRR